jgi:hypothetical protein
MEIVTLPSRSPLDRFINSLAMTARRMWLATVIAKVVFGSAMTNFLSR